MFDTVVFMFSLATFKHHKCKANAKTHVTENIGVTRPNPSAAPAGYHHIRL